MKIPYGVSNFKMLISEGYTYVDKTTYIAELEAVGRYQVLLRPRRFGKSLFIQSEREMNRRYPDYCCWNAARM